MAKENREHKDSVFADLFCTDISAKKNLLELYNALYGTSYTNPELIDLVRLEEVLFKNLKNDVAFTMAGRRIVLSEHQSTVNPNMPMRNLLYIAREYEKLIPTKERYRTTLVKIPTPDFIVFYNGTKDYAVEQLLHLSDAFLETESRPQLELTVRVININSDKKHELLKKCKILQEYSLFVDSTRKYKDDPDQLQKAVRECINNGVLAEYLLRKSSEVINMLMDEYDYNLDMEVQREDAAKEAAEKTAKEVSEAKLVEYVDKITASLHISPKDACQMLGESYEKYLEIKSRKPSLTL